MLEQLKRIFNKINLTFKDKFRAVVRFVDDRPLHSFFGVLGIVLVLIIAGNIIRNPAPKKEEKVGNVKEVETYSIGEAPRIRVQAKVEKSGVVKITALSGGVVQKIYKHEGETASRGTWLFWLSSNYQGGTVSTVTRQIAEENLSFIKDTYDAQREIIAKNKETAEKLESQSADLRDISAKSVEDTKSLISLNENVINMMDEQIKGLEAIDVNGSSSSAVLQLKQGKAGVLAGLNQARASLRATEYQTNSDNEPAALAGLQKDTTLKQLEIQEKSLDLNKEIASLNLRLAQIQESLMYPVSPVEGVVERVYVKEGQNVTPGTILATVTGNKNCANALAAVSARIAQNVSRLEASRLKIGNGNIELFPSYVSTEPTEGSLHSILFAIPDEYSSVLSNDQIITIDLPVGMAKTNSIIPYIPLDAVYQTQTDSYIYIVTARENAQYASSRKIELGEVTGEYVEVKNGLHAADQVIMDRNVIEGDEVKTSYGIKQ